VKYKDLRLPPDELNALVLQKPNKKILGVPFYLMAYNLFYKEGRLQKIVGEPPVIFDSLYVQKTLKNFDFYLNKKGYFHHHITHQEIYNKQKNKVKVIYNIKVDKPFRVNSYKIDFSEQPHLQKVIENEKDKQESVIFQGDIFDVDKLDNERERLTNILRNNGFYYFNKNDITFKVDTNNYKVDIIAKINKKSLKDYRKFKRYYLGKIFVKFKVKNPTNDTVIHNQVRYINAGASPVKISTIQNQLFLKPHDLYQENNIVNTYKFLSRLQIFKVINIQMNEVADSLNATIQLEYQPSKRFTAELTATNNSSNLGIFSSVGYLNKNLFKHAEKFSVNLKGGLEVQPLLNTQQSEPIFNYLPFNTIMVAPNIELKIPTFLLPVKASKFSINNAPVSIFSIDYNYQKRPDYERYVANFSFGYQWNETKFKSHKFYPVQINYIQLNPSQRFQQTLDNLNDPFLINSYQDQFIPAMSYEFLFTNKKNSSDNKFQIFNLSLESSGNLLYLYSQYTNQPKTAEGYYTYYNVRFSQYVLGTIDFRNYINLKHTSFVQHLFVGVGVPYGNTTVLPFVKSFFAGGVNDLRGWRARTLGPGSLSDTLSVSVVDQIGNFKMVGNLEYRFDVIKYLEMALFVDAGNIWLLAPDANRPNGEINPSRLWQDIALDAGIGVRLDFEFFLIRFDFANSIKNPAKPINQQFSFSLKNTILNLGIGYPF
jgi:outer membrane protein assembly factor BamA